MEINKVGGWLQVLGNLGLLVGLLLVGVQINQSNKIAMANLVSASFQQDTDRIVAQLGENPATILAKAMMEPEKLTPEEILVTIAYAQWRISRIQRDAIMEDLGVYLNDEWRMQIVPSGQQIGSLPVAREFLLNFYQGDPRWWVRDMQGAAETQPKQSYRTFVEEYLAIAQSYAEKD